MAKAKKLPSGNWRVRAYAGTDPDGKQIIKSFTASTKKEAEFLAVQFLTQHKEPAAEMTVGKAIDKYIESKNNILSPTTINSYRGIRRNYFSDIIDIPLKNLNRQAIQAAVNAESVKVSAKTVKNAYGLLTATLSVYAPDLNTRVSLPKQKKILRSMPDPLQIIRAVRGTDIELPCLLAIWLSLRMSEVRGLKVSDIHDSKMYIRETIVTVAGKHITKESTKTFDSTRVEDVPETIQTLIDKLPPEQEHLTELSGQAIYKRFVRLQQKNGIDPVIRFHDLRHLNASIMKKLNVPDTYAMERGGWSTPATLKSVYQHTFSDEREEVNRKVNDYFEKLISEADEQ